MIEAFAGIHWVAVSAGTLVFMVLGATYFMVLFPKQYLYVTGRENLPEEEQRVSGAIFIVGPMICSLVTVIADAVLVSALGITSVPDALALGLVVGLGFLVPMTFNIAINPLFPRPILYGLLNAPYFLVANVIACTLIVLIPF
ncbi:MULTISPECIES: DUF1761 domain-containing protein [unclassified Rhizobium]|uniref:DUF1761 domain-containing protein n=1 Tax=unclassified Rhizobium TaxID=2613769 RepID=UPI00071236B2|nr:MULTISPECIES: DUF1761 domain-containing protein [unclassified Rhizobium]KQS83841.1 hypothetical protein ASG50_10995 [Rhizobium sp. Leaf386]KQT04979.1 hypothetical protein ASG42_22685 [Rhizobium sp. Leaf391]KQU08781.1 hypothetical protein ASG68_21640 [Rhizobium sp. Leaf453]